MKTSAVTEQDIKSLKKTSSKSMRLTLGIIFLLFFLLLLAVGLVNLRLCARFSDMAGTNMRGVIQGWFAGIDISREYSGAYSKAMERWVTAITEFALAGYVALVFVLTTKVANRNARILRFIQEKGL